MLDDLDQREDAACTGMAERQKAAGGVGGEATTDLQRSVLDEGAAFAGFAESGRLDAEQQVDREVVTESGDVDVVT